MAIDANERKNMKAGAKLVAKYKKQEHTAEVIEGEEGKLLYRLADGREFKSPSAAASAVMGGIAANGWRWWSIATDEASEPPAKTAAPKTRKATGGTKRARKGTVAADSAQTDEQTPSETDATEAGEDAPSE